MGNSSNKLSKKDLQYLEAKTHFSRKQIKEWHRGFVKDCPSGELNRGKFLNIYQTMFPDGKACAFYEHVFRTFDEDGSGKIDFREFLQAISITQSGKPEDKLELAFRLYDIDRNGSIEEGEMTEIIRAIYLMTGQEYNKAAQSPVSRTKDIFSKMDVNHDGVLSREEFIQGCMNDETLFRLLACSNTDPATTAQQQQQAQQLQRQHQLEQQQLDLEHQQQQLEQQQHQLQQQQRDLVAQQLELEYQNQHSQENNNQTDMVQQVQVDYQR